MKLDNVFSVRRHESRVAYSGRDQIEKCVFNKSEWLLDKFNFDLSLVARLGGHSAPGPNRGKECFPGMTITYTLIQMVEKIAEKSDKARIN